MYFTLILNSLSTATSLPHRKDGIVTFDDNYVFMGVVMLGDNVTTATLLLF